jgi:hypothetical protein
MRYRVFGFTGSILSKWFLLQWFFLHQKLPLQKTTVLNLLLEAHIFPAKQYNTLYIVKLIKSL